MSGADLSNLVNEAALVAVSEGEDTVHAEHFEVARDRILMGQKRDSMVLTDADKEETAYHEAGHAICAAVLPNADPVHKVTIIPRGMALGVTMMLPERDRHTYRQDFVEDELVVSMGGRVAEDLVFGVISSGAHSDLVYATQSARRMVTRWGMSDAVGPMAWDSHDQVFLGDEMLAARDYSDETARVIDKEIQRILVEQEKRCRDLLTKHRQALDLVARALLEHETIDGAEVTRLLKFAESGATGESTTAEVAVPELSEFVEDRTPVD
jgi:cell division protease FtsH